MFNKSSTINFTSLLIILLYFGKVYPLNDVNFSNVKCKHTYDSCDSWISTIFLILDINTSDDEREIIKQIMSNTVKNCPATQPLILQFNTCFETLQNCIGSYDCLNVIDEIELDEFLENNCRNTLWNSFKNYFEDQYLNSKGMSSYIITNLDCSNWENNDLSLFYKQSREISDFIVKYSVVTKLIHITDTNYGGVCIINSAINYSQPLLDVITIDPIDIDQLSLARYGMCSNDFDYVPNLFGTDLDSYSNCTLYTIGIDEHSCLTYTILMYFAIKDGTSKEELNKILTLASRVFSQCTMKGTTVIYWSSNPNNRVMQCDPSTESCEEKIKSLTIYDLSYANTSTTQIGIESLVKVVNSCDDFNVGEAVVFYIFSNLDSLDFTLSVLAKSLFKTGFEYGYFLYKNKIITHFVDLASENKIPGEMFRSISNAANEYFVVDRIANLTEQLDGLAVALQVCTADVYYNSTSTKKSTSPNIEIILLIVCGSMVVVVAICASCCIRCRRLTYKFKLSKFSKRFADNEAACEALEIAHRNKNNKEFQECMEIFNKTIEDRYVHCPNGCGSDRFEMHIEDLAINYNSRLGSGAFASVYKGFIKGTNPLKNACQSLNVALDVMMNLTNEVAVKTCLKAGDTTDKANLLGEIEFMKQLGYHPHIVNIIGCITDWKLPLLVLEYCENEDLLKLLRKQNINSIKKSDSEDRENELTIKDLYSFAWQVSDGMVYLASKNVIHRDIAARNILITKNNVAKIGDFGLCRSTEELNYTTKGGKFPIRWMSYEALKFYTFSIKSDVWAYGVLLYEIFSLGEVPYKTVQLYELVDHLGEGNRLTQPELCPDDVYQLMCNCWDEDPEKRPSFVSLREFMAKHLELNSDSYGYIQLLPDFNKIYMEITETMQKPVTANKECDIHEKNINDDNKSINDADNEVENVNIDSI